MRLFVYLYLYFNAIRNIDPNSRGKVYEYESVINYGLQKKYPTPTKITTRFMNKEIVFLNVKKKEGRAISNNL